MGQSVMGIVMALIGMAFPLLEADSSIDVSSSVLEELTRNAQYAAATNCAANHNETSPGSAVYCDKGFCDLIAASDTEIIKGFWGLSPGDTTGYLALDRTHKRILLAYRGTVSDENGETDLKFQHVDASDACTGCKAHEGFWGASNAAIESLQSSVESAAKENPDYTITVIGHSLGGALATLGAVSLRNAGHTVDLYTYGAPSVGNYDFAKYITEQTAGKNYRVTHTNDEVPKVLYRSSREWLLHLIVPEYSQSSPEYWVTSENGVIPTVSDIKFIEGVNNEDGNLSQGGITLNAHGWYLGNMSVCAEI
ncbi:alpha/beta-hydrolase [Aspergillus steynii IBT 23096]|uniref:feruloyl esterase n=1 Tax=Aspergillus steynii IBT 23096 TaxID=1392250 RepID=A0A2I2GI65_9EURO|nr:alpha/beta-hydrolase [Aspergillus steynii IBT 23096]PLB52573.1 alpha/beta-hydrolase [Aspergillus steynii IBT 23096]